MTKSPKNMKWRVRLVKEFSKILSDGIKFIIRKIPKLIKMQENL